MASTHRSSATLTLALALSLACGPMDNPSSSKPGSNPGGTGSTSQSALTSAPDCVYSQGFWKTHPESWPLTSLKLGTVDYSKDELLALLETPPKGGDASLILAHQLIAAKLNVALDPALAAAPAGAIIAAADALLGASKVPFDMAAGPAADAVDYAATLELFNTGGGGFPECKSPPTGGGSGGNGTGNGNGTGGGTTCTQADQFGPAAGYNVVVSGSFVGDRSDVEGALVAGDVIASAYSIGDKLPYGHEGTSSALMVRGTLSLTNGQINGQAWIGDAAVLDHGTITGIYNDHLNDRHVAFFPFDEAQAKLQLLSSRLGALASDGKVASDDSGHTLVLKDGTVFSVDAARLDFDQGVTGVRLRAAADAVVVINVRTAAPAHVASFRFMGFDTGATADTQIPESRILWNFPDALAIKIEGVGVPGTLLAPFAAVTSQNSVVRGSIFAASFNGQGQVNAAPFEGCLPGWDTATRKISGTVTGDVKQGITVTLSGAATATATTDANGAYTFSGLQDGSYAVTPSYTGYAFAPASHDVTVSGADVPGVDFTMTVIAAPIYAISGKVSGDGCKAATLTLAHGGATDAVVTANPGGVYTLVGVPPATYTLTPSGNGCTFNPTSATVAVTSSDVTGQDFAGTRPSTTYGISGKVTVSGTGAGLAGVTVTLGGASVAPATTDASGAYAFSLVPPGTYSVSAAKDGYTFEPASRVVVVSTASVTGNDFVAAAAMAPTYTISGQVAGDVAAGVTITLTGTKVATAVTGADGKYAFSGLPVGSYTISGSLAGYTFTPGSITLSLSANATGQDFHAAAAPGHAITGKVDGNSHAGVTLTLTRDGAVVAVAKTPSSGAYSFAGMSDGTYVLTPSLAGHTFSPSSRTVTVNGGDVSLANIHAL